MDIEGLGAENIDLFFNAGLIKTAADIFTLKDRRTEVQQALFERREAQAREREAAKGTTRKKVLSAEERTYEGLDKLFAAIDARREPELDRFIFALGIRHIGETTAAVLGPNLLDHRRTDPRRQGDRRRPTIRTPCFRRQRHRRHGHRSAARLLRQ